MSANPHRGEVALSLGGRDFVLRPSYQALVAIETALGQGLVALARRFHSGDYGLRELAVIVAEGLRASGEEAPLARVGELVAEAGVAATLEAVLPFLSNALEGGGKKPVSAQQRSP